MGTTRKVSTTAETSDRNEGSSIKINLLLAAGVLLSAFAVTQYTHFGSTLRHRLSRAFDSWSGLHEVNYEAVCSGHGVHLVSGDCFCDIGYTGTDCSTLVNDIEMLNPAQNSVLIVVDAFETLVDSMTAFTPSASAADAVLTNTASMFPVMAKTLAKQGSDVTVLYTGSLDFDQLKFETIRDTYAAFNVKFLSLPKNSYFDSSSKVTDRSYAFYRYLTTPGNNRYAVIHAPSHSGVLYYTLKARHQGLACFQYTTFVSHFDSLPSLLLERWEHDDSEGAKFGLDYMTEEKQVLESLKRDYFHQAVTEMADFVVAPNQESIDYAKNVLKWSLPEATSVQPYVPHVSSRPLSKASEPTEFVIIGTPQLSTSSGLKLVVEALKKVSSKSKLTITFLGQSVYMASPKLESVDYLSMNLPSTDWRIEAASTPSEVVKYFSKVNQVAVVPHLFSHSSSPYIVQSLIASGIPVYASDLSGVKELYDVDDRSTFLFESNSTDALVSVFDHVKIVAPKIDASNVKKVGQIKAQPFACPKPDTKDALPSVSIVITHYNRPKLLKQALESIERQTYPQDKLDVVLVDDGSTEEEATEFVNELAWEWWETKGWKVVREARRWVGAARNTGVKYAKSDYIIFVDDDDLSKPHKVETLIRVALTTDADVVTAGHDLFHEETYAQTRLTTSATSRFLPIGPASAAGTLQNVFGDSSFLVKRSFFIETGGFSEDFGVGFEDYEYLARISLKKNVKIESVPESLTWYRKLNDRSSVTENSELKQNQVLMMRPYIAAYPMQEKWEQSLLRFVQRTLFARDHDMEVALKNTTIVNTFEITSTISMPVSSSVVSDTTSTTSVLSSQDHSQSPSLTSSDAPSTITSLTSATTITSAPRCVGATCPSISQIYPDVVPIGSRIRVIGQNFAQNAKVTIGDIESLVTFVSTTVLEVIVPNITDVKLEAQFASYEVQVKIGIDVSNVRTVKLYRPLPLITGISPSEFTLGSGSLTVAVSGKDFLNGDAWCWIKHRTREGSTRIFKVNAEFISSSRINCPISATNIVFSTNYHVDVTYANFPTFPEQAFIFALLPKSAAAQETSVKVIAPPPVVTLTEFDLTGTEILIKFDRATNGLLLNDKSCGDLFVLDSEDPRYAQLSPDLVHCRFTFVSPDFVRIRVSQSFASTANRPPNIGLLLKFQPNTIFAHPAEFPIAFSGDSLAIAAPSDPIIPAVVLNMPKNLGACAQLDIDLTRSSGNAGRYYAAAIYTVSLLDGSGSETSIQSSLNDFSVETRTSGRLFWTIPHTLFTSEATWRFTFTLKNFMNAAVSTVTADLSVDTARLIPLITVNGPTSITRDQRVFLTGAVSYKLDQECLKTLEGSVLSAVGRSWSAPGLSSFKTSWASPSGANLVVPPFSFAPGTSQQFQFRVTSLQQEYVSSFTVNVGFNKLDAAISGGSRTISVSDELVLEGLILDNSWLDDDELASHINEYTFAWSCSKINLETKSSTSCGVSLNSVQQISFAAGSLPAASDEIYRFTLVLSHNSGRSASTSAEISIVSLPVPNVKVELSNPRPSARDARFFLRGTVESNSRTDFKYLWVSKDICDDRAATVLNTSAPHIFNSPLTSRVLSFKTNPPILQPGGTYCFEFLAGYSDETDLANYGRAAVSFTVRSEPRGGTCHVVGNSTGYALTTSFQFNCAGWITDSLSGDIRYAYFIVNADGSRTPLSTRTKSGLFRYVFGAPGNYILEVDVTDENDGKSAISPTIEVTVLNSNVDVSNFATSQIENFKNTGNVQEGLVAASAVVTAIQHQKNVEVKTQVVSFLGEIANSTVVDYKDVGPTVLGVLQEIIRSGLDINSPALSSSLDLVQKLTSDMNSDAKNDRSCYDSDTAQQILNSTDTILGNVWDASTPAAKTLLAIREPIMQKLATCYQRQIPCGANPASFSSQFSNLQLGAVDANATSDIGNVKFPSLSSMLGTKPSECVQYRMSEDSNYLKQFASGNVSSNLFVFDFRNETVNGGSKKVIDADDSINSKFDQEFTFIIQIDDDTRKRLAAANRVPECVYFKRTNGNNGIWDSTGCRVILSAPTYIKCACNHLTEFTINVQDSGTSNEPPDQPPDDSTSPPSVTNPTKSGNSYVGIIIGVIVGVIIGAVIGLTSYKKYRRGKTMEAHRVVPEDGAGDDFALVDPNASEEGLNTATTPVYIDSTPTVSKMED